mmetsp:Transcript_3043/g.8260  ORF Transcript_3043/g.8260 Transcript_3043/m.8260 type:complete len:139 (+) Transcript_3043:861-1277(+)
MMMMMMMKKKKKMLMKLIHNIINIDTIEKRERETRGRDRIVSHPQKSFESSKLRGVEGGVTRSLGRRSVTTRKGGVARALVTREEESPSGGLEGRDGEGLTLTISIGWMQQVATMPLAPPLMNGLTIFHTELSDIFSL